MQGKIGLPSRVCDCFKGQEVRISRAHLVGPRASLRMFIPRMFMVSPNKFSRFVSCPKKKKPR